MLEQASKGFTAATDVADYLAKRGMPFRQAHEVVGRLVLYCERHGKGLEDLTPEEFRQASPLFGNDIAKDLDPAGIARARNTYGGTGDEAVRVQMGEAKAALERDESTLG
jgi:argininosuccinate lyase